MTMVGALTSDRVKAVIVPMGLAIIAAGEAIAGALDAPTWVYITIPVVTLLITVAGLLLEQRRKEAQGETDRIDALAGQVRWPLPRVADLKPSELGVKQSAIAREVGADERYAPREKDKDIDRALETSSLVVIVGESGAGKSRSAFEAARRTLPAAKVILPKEAGSLGEALRRGLGEDLGGETVLVWLDDLERHLGGAGFTLEVLSRLKAGGARCHALATLRAQERDRILRDDELSRPGRELLHSDQTTLVDLARRFTPHEKAEALGLYGDERVRGALERQGLGEFFVAGRDLLHRFQDSRATCPEGGALVAAAIDWRRAGLTRPIGEPALKALYPHYFERFGVEVDDAAQQYDRAVRWGREPIYATARLLSARESGYVVDDYVLDSVQREHADPIPDAVWSVILGSLEDAFERVDVGVAAYGQGQATVAESAWRTALASGHAAAAPRAALNLGILLRERDPAGAAETFRQAVASGNADAAPRAALALGLLLRERQPKGAADALRQAMASGHAEAAPRAALALGLLLREHDRAAAVDALREAASSTDAVAAAGGAFALGRLLRKDDPEGAAEAFRQAAASGHRAWSREAAAALARLEIERQH